MFRGSDKHVFTLCFIFLGPPGPLAVALYVGQSVTLIDSDTLKHPFGGPSRFFFYLFPVPILSQLIVTIIFVIL